MPALLADCGVEYGTIRTKWINKGGKGINMNKFKSEWLNNKKEISPENAEQISELQTVAQEIVEEFENEGLPEPKFKFKNIVLVSTCMKENVPALVLLEMAKKMVQIYMQVIVHSMKITTLVFFKQNLLVIIYQNLLFILKIQLVLTKSLGEISGHMIVMEIIKLIFGKLCSKVMIEKQLESY